MGAHSEAAAAAIQDHLDAALSEAELRTTRASIDLDADEAACPACEGAIPRGATRCPECGLRFG